ncbi:ubiquitin-like protein Pup [Saccharopolyspora griseoalba]|uniref:Prokaryotic ubiquitin-like protein Pup n=1 Tax=Saccharopolyspora griseoalba TaxID=1431848 RepID=A0ABW2LRD4_9PSEU
MQQDHTRRNPANSEQPEEAEPEVQGRERREELDDATEEVLAEIDDVLEDSPEAFVRSYVQKGGQ